MHHPSAIGPHGGLGGLDGGDGGQDGGDGHHTLNSGGDGAGGEIRIRNGATQ